MATHRTDVSVLFGVPTDPADDHPGGPFDLELAGDAIVPTVASAAPRCVADLIGLQILVALDRLKARGIDAKIKVLSRVPGPSGLVPGQRDPAPRPASGRPEVVIRTHPTIGSALLVGSTVDYAIAPGEPRELNGRDDRDVEDESAFGLDAHVAPGEPDHTAAPPPSTYIDYDAIDTLFRFGCQSVEARA